MIKYCTNCGSKTKEGSKFCSNCGTKIQPKEKTSKITIKTSEAKEIATSLIYSTGALLPENPKTQLSKEDQQIVNTTLQFLEKIFKAFPDLNNESWIGHSEYNKIKKHIENEPKTTKKAHQAPKPETQEPPPPPPETSTPEPDRDETSNTVDTDNKEETVKSRIIGAHTIFPQIHYILLLTGRRIIGARKDRFDSAMESGAAFGGVLGAIVGAGVDAVKGPRETTQDKLEDLSLDQIVAYDKQNWEIPYVDLMQVELKKPGWLQDGEIILFDSERRFDLVFDVEKDEFEKVINMFKEVVPDKLKIK